MTNQFSSPFGANTNPFGGNQPQMHILSEEDENDPKATTSAFSPSFGGDASSDAPPAARGPITPDYPAQYNYNRRVSVSAESLKPNADSYDNWSPPFSSKSPDQISRLTNAIGGNFLFSHLEEEQSALILGALVEKPIPAKGIKVCFYSLASWGFPALASQETNLDI